MKVSSVSQMRDMDRSAVETFGIPEELLMENAGQAVYLAIRQHLEIKNRRFVVFAGLGNNGGDGFVVARKLYSIGGLVKVFVMGDPARFKGPAKLNLDILYRMSIEIHRLEAADNAERELLQADAVVDAIFGTGLDRSVEGRYRDVIELINTSKKPVFSVDIPSGIHGNTGQVMGVAVRAGCTVTFGLPKLGNMLYPGYDFCGTLYVSHISFPPSLYNTDTLKTEINRPPELPGRDKNGHKKTFGEALFVAGAASYYGAPYFSALAFMKAGGGYARLAAPKSIVPFIAGKGSEIVFAPQDETPRGGISLRNKEALLELSGQVDMVVLGPGLSLEDEPQDLVRQLAPEIHKPIVVDGDGLTALSKDMGILKRRPGPTILTPHLGEMARITGTGVAEIDADKIGILGDFASEFNASVVLKGAHSLIGDPHERVSINLSGNSGMATAGSGDVLTGTIAAMLTLGLPVNDAVRKGVFIHGLSGDLAAGKNGEDGITAQDILDSLPLAMKMDREGLDPALSRRYEGPTIL